ncbi:hypothetical protein BASA60_003479 [Batrachochytrium salamandrivorans]|nr:hypothetical protein BASA60_003479 [Batrachochytrium salamandrivorans]
MKLAAAAILSLVATATYASPAAYSENQVSAEYSAANAPVIVHLQKRTGDRPGFMERIEEIQKSVNHNHHRQGHQDPQQDPQQRQAHPRNDYQEQQKQQEEEYQRQREQRLQKHQERLQQQEQQEQRLLQQRLKEQLEQERQLYQEELQQKQQEQKQQLRILLQKQQEGKVEYQDQQGGYLNIMQTVEGENHNSENTRGFEEGQRSGRLDTIPEEDHDPLESPEPLKNSRKRKYTGSVHEREVDSEPAVELVQGDYFDEQSDDEQSDDEDPSQSKAPTKVRLFSGEWFRKLFGRNKSTSASGKQSDSEDSSQNKVRTKGWRSGFQWFKNLFKRKKSTDTSE